MNEGLEFEKRVGEFRVCRCMHDVPRRNDVVRRERWMVARLFEMDGDPRSVHSIRNFIPKLAAGPAGRAYTEEHFTCEK